MPVACRQTVYGARYSRYGKCVHLPIHAPGGTSKGYIQAATVMARLCDGRYNRPCSNMAVGRHTRSAVPCGCVGAVPVEVSHMHRMVRRTLPNKGVMLGSSQIHTISPPLPHFQFKAECLLIRRLTKSRGSTEDQSFFAGEEKWEQ